MNISSYNNTSHFLPPPRSANQSLSRRRETVRNKRKEFSSPTVKVQNMLTFLTARDNILKKSIDASTIVRQSIHHKMHQKKHYDHI